MGVGGDVEEDVGEDVVEGVDEEEVEGVDEGEEGEEGGEGESVVGDGASVRTKTTRCCFEKHDNVFYDYVL